MIGGATHSLGIPIESVDGSPEIFMNASGIFAGQSANMALQRMRGESTI